MSAEQRSPDVAQTSGQAAEQDACEEAPTGASSQEGSAPATGSADIDLPGAELPGAELPDAGDPVDPDEPLGHVRADAAAAYAAAQHGAPSWSAEGEAAASSEPEPAEPEAGASDGVDRVEQDLAELSARAERADEYLLLAQRTQADFENYRKRAAREASLAQERGVAKLVRELLPAIDNLDRALKALGEEHSQYAEGIRLVHTDLLSALQRVGVEPFSPDGEPFDPQVHEAVAQQPVDGIAPGTVAEVFQQGFRLGETVLRPARVLVAG